MYPPYLSHYVFHRQIRAAVSSVLRLSEASYLTSSEGCLGHGAGRDAGLEGPLGRRKTGSGGGRLAGGKSPAKSNSKTRLWSGKVFTVKWNLGAKGSGHLSTGASRELSPAGFLVSTRCCITPLTGLAGEGGRRGRDVRKGHKRGHMAKFSELATVFWGTHQRGHGVSGATEWRPLSVCRSRL